MSPTLDDDSRRQCMDCEALLMDDEPDRCWACQMITQTEDQLFDTWKEYTE